MAPATTLTILGAITGAVNDPEKAR